MSGWPGLGWGYPFPWQSRSFYLPVGTPTVVVTAFAGEAFLDAHAATGDDGHLSTALDAFIGMDAAGVITEWNVQAEQMFGWPRQEAIGRLLSATIIPAQHREAHERGLRHFLAAGSEEAKG